jgi:RimJ/RimL family protein N-acetyltransferase
VQQPEKKPSTPPYFIRTERFVIRCWNPHDAGMLREAIDSSLEHIRPWMSWTKREPEPLEETVERLRQFRAKFDLDESFVYGVFSADESEVIGGTSLGRIAADEAFVIGYWIRESRIRQGLATEITAALTRVAFELCGVDRVEIQVMPTNTASRKIPPKLGYVEEATLRRRLRDGEGELQDGIVFTMLAEEFPLSPCAGVSIEAYDASGERVL